MDIEELKRLHAEIWDSPGDPSEWDIAIHNAFPAILAKLEAAQRLRDAVRPFCKIAEGTVGRIPTERLSCANWHELWKAAKAFDKE